VVTGATREPDAGFDVRVTAKAVGDVLHGALRIAPGLAHATFLEARVGLRPVARDGVPVIGKWPGLDDVYVCTGHGAYGLLMGPRSADAISKIMLGQQPGIDLDPFAPSRFVCAASVPPEQTSRYDWGGARFPNRRG
jgi:D-amino-acid dehydrogenase